MTYGLSDVNRAGGGGAAAAATTASYSISMQLFDAP